MKIQRAFKKIILLVVLLAICFFALAPIFIYAYFAPDLVSKEAIMNNNNKGILLYDRFGRPFFKFYEAKEKIPVSLSEVPLYFQEAIIATEDKDFYKHPGFSAPAIIRAFYFNLLERNIEYGASTITQQLVKNSLLKPEKSFFRKYQEIILAFEIERLYTKKEILEMYLNSIYFGEGATGIGTATQVYFGKSVKDLTIAESALLTGILPAPSQYSPISGNVQKALALQRRVLRKMLEQKYITPTQEKEAKLQNIHIAKAKNLINVQGIHFALMVRDKLLQTYSEQELAMSGFKIITTLNLDWQAFAQDVVYGNVQRLAPNGVSNAAAVVIDPKASEILALVGSVDWENPSFGKINMAITPRQSGSAFKPLVYAKAFEERKITPSTILKDVPTTFENNYKPKDYDGYYRGNMLPRRALANSINIASVEVMRRVEVENILSFAKSLGITSLKDPSNYGLSLVLGTGEVPLVELTNAYAVFANSGYFNAPVAILKIENKLDETIYVSHTSSQKVLDGNVAFLISSILSDNTARQEIFGNALTINRPAAVKTGTTENYKDALTIGYTPTLVVGVWVGNSDNKPMDQIAGSLGAAPIWAALMMEFSKNSSIEQFEKPPDIQSAYICNYNGLKARISTSSAYLEYFLPGTVPLKFCDGSLSKTPNLKDLQTLQFTPSPIFSSPTPQSTLN